jgi:hypothetical protein
VKEQIYKQKAIEALTEKENHKKKKFPSDEWIGLPSGRLIFLKHDSS